MYEFLHSLSFFAIFFFFSTQKVRDAEHERIEVPLKRNVFTTFSRTYKVFLPFSSLYSLFHAIFFSLDLFLTFSPIFAISHFQKENRCVRGLLGIFLLLFLQDYCTISLFYFSLTLQFSHTILLSISPTIAKSL